MAFDTKGFRREHEGKRLRIEFNDGEVCEGDLISVSKCDEHASCCGIVFDLWKSNKPEKYSQAVQQKAHPALWSEMEFVKTFEVLETEAA
jgi:hypothetical protein